MSDLRAIIEEEVRRAGILPFARFMELALYCPKFGYYERPHQSPGRGGDFYTSVSTGPVFGELLAWQFAEWAKACGPEGWHILEAGAHDGQLAANILSWLKQHRPGLVTRLEYWILEPSAALRRWQEEKLRGFPVRWYENWNALPTSGVVGVVFANELLDAMPVHRLGWNAAGSDWFEWGVAQDAGELVWAKTAIVDNRLKPSLPDELLAVLPDGFIAESCPAATEWWREAGRKLRRGQLCTFDYGLSAEEFFAPERSQGTLRAYYRHHQNQELLARVGEQDLTAHVNFTALQGTGEAEGLKTKLLEEQGRFLTKILERAVAQEPSLGLWSPSQVRQFQTLTHPGHLGASFKVLIQAR